MQVVPRSQAAQSSLPMRAVTNVGRRSLECFCMSTILVYAMAALLVRGQSFGPVSMWMAGTAIVLGLCLFALVVDWTDAKPWRGPRRAPRDDKPKSDVDAAIVRRPA
jgi:uncharacterized membrane protein YeiB